MEVVGASYPDIEWPGVGACGSDRACEREDRHHESPGERLHHLVSNQELHLEEIIVMETRDGEILMLLQVILKVNNLGVVLKATLIIYK